MEKPEDRKRQKVKRTVLKGCKGSGGGENQEE